MAFRQNKLFGISEALVTILRCSVDSIFLETPQLDEERDALQTALQYNTRIYRLVQGESGGKACGGRGLGGCDDGLDLASVSYHSVEAGEIIRYDRNGWTGRHGCMASEETGYNALLYHPRG